MAIQSYNRYKICYKEIQGIVNHSFSPPTSPLILSQNLFLIHLFQYDACIILICQYEKCFECLNHRPLYFYSIMYSYIISPLLFVNHCLPMMWKKAKYFFYKQSTCNLEKNLKTCISQIVLIHTCIWRILSGNMLTLFCK